MAPPGASGARSLSTAAASQFSRLRTGTPRRCAVSTAVAGSSRRPMEANAHLSSPIFFSLFLTAACDEEPCDDVRKRGRAGRGYTSAFSAESRRPSRRRPQREIEPGECRAAAARNGTEIRAGGLGDRTHHLRMTTPTVRGSDGPTRSSRGADAAREGVDPEDNISARAARRAPAQMSPSCRSGGRGRDGDRTATEPARRRTLPRAGSVMMALPTGRGNYHANYSDDEALDALEAARRCLSAPGWPHGTCGVGPSMGLRETGQAGGRRGAYSVETQPNRRGHPLQRVATTAFPTSSHGLAKQ